MVNFAKRKFIGKRMEQRRKELGLSQDYLADKLGVNQSTITRYEKGSIDNEKLIILNAVASVLQVSVEWLTGETDEITSTITDKRELYIRDAMDRILKLFPLKLGEKENQFSMELLLLLLKEYEAFYDSFVFANKRYSKSTEQPAYVKEMGFTSSEEFNDMMFLREITHSINTYRDISDCLKLYPKNPDNATNQLHRLLDLYSE